MTARQVTQAFDLAMKMPIRELINWEWLEKEMGRIGRETLIANGYSKKKVAKLTGAEAFWVANELMRRFCTGR